MAKYIVKPTKHTNKRKQVWPAKSASKQARNWDFWYLWYLSNLFVILASNNNKLNRISLSEILKSQVLFFLYLSAMTANEQSKIDWSPSQINGKAFFV